MIRTHRYNLRVHRCGDHLLVLTELPQDVRLIAGTAAPAVAKTLADSSAVALVHVAPHNPPPNPEAALSTLRTPSKPSPWRVLRRDVDAHDADSWTSCIPTANQVLTVSGHQPAYLGYVGYFAKIAASSLFTVAGDMRFGRQTFQHRQRLQGAGGVDRWLTVPLQNGRGSGGQAIYAKRVADDPSWASDHIASIADRYRHLPYYDTYIPALCRIYSLPWRTLLSLTDALSRLTAHWLGLETTTIATIQDQRYAGLRRGLRIAAEVRELMADADVRQATYLAGVAGAKYLLEPIAGSDKREIEAIVATGAQVSACSADLGSIKAWGLAKGEPAIGLLFAAGPSAAYVLQDCVRITPIDMA